MNTLLLILKKKIALGCSHDTKNIFFRNYGNSSKCIRSRRNSGKRELWSIFKREYRMKGQKKDQVQTRSWKVMKLAGLAIGFTFNCRSMKRILHREFT